MVLSDISAHPVILIDLKRNGRTELIVLKPNSSGRLSFDQTINPALIQNRGMMLFCHAAEF
jgi:hypothetical protein